jgi:hypothetical protein
MTIEIDQPELEELIRQRMESGEFQNVTDLIRRAMESLAVPAVNTADSATNRQRAEAFSRWVERHATNVVLADEAMTRESFYGERG